MRLLEPNVKYIHSHVETKVGFLYLGGLESSSSKIQAN